jgi:hypothetical protein
MSFGGPPAPFHYPNGEGEESPLAGCTTPSRRRTLPASFTGWRKMIRTERGLGATEQLLVLWTLLLEGYVPVAHIVAVPDEPEILASQRVVGAAGADAARARAPLGCRLAA